MSSCERQLAAAGPSRPYIAYSYGHIYDGSYTVYLAVGAPGGGAGTRSIFVSESSNKGGQRPSQGWEREGGRDELQKDKSQSNLVQ